MTSLGYADYMNKTTDTAHWNKEAHRLAALIANQPLISAATWFRFTKFCKRANIDPTETLNQAA